MSKYLRIEVNEELFGKLPTQIKYKTQIGVCVQEALKYRGYNRAEANQKWDIFWAQKQSLNSIHQNNRITMNQVINHFRSYPQLCRKDNLNRNLKKHKKNLQKQGKTKEAQEYNFFPVTYHLPIQYNIFCEEFKKCASDKQNVWIMKPVSKSQGKGIFLFNKLSTISEWAEQQGDAYIVQKYIHNPLLIGGKKFDLRLYVLVTSYKPLKAYVYRQGFARFTTQRYDTTDIQNSEIHLTNVAIQKHSSEYNKENGGKWQLSTLKLYLLSKYSQETVENCFYQIQKLIFKTLKGVSKLMTGQKNCFELYGFDVMIDKDFKPWLIQVNGSPSMRANTKEDRKLKRGLVDDVLTIVDMEQILTGNQLRVGGFDLTCENDCEKKVYDKFTDPSAKISFLGCLNNRKKAYFELAHEINKKANLNARNRQQICESPKKKVFSVRKQGNNRINSTVKKQNPQSRELYESKTSGQISRLKLGANLVKITPKTQLNAGIYTIQTQKRT